MRPLGIPTMKDRAQQATVLLALAPVVETTADKNSYGFRQQRSCADAMTVLQSTEKRQHAVDSGGDIKSCFRQDFTRLAFGSCPDGPSHSPKVVEIRVHGKNTFFTKRRTGLPGWIISPALANCALEGLERLLQERYPAGRRLSPLEVKHRVSISSVTRMTSLSPVNRKELLEGRIKPLSSSSCKNGVLNSLPTKTVITHVEHGFDFLGQNVRRYLTGNCSSSLPRRMLEPSWMESANNQRRTWRVCRRSDRSTQTQRFRGWANYHRHAVSKRIFGRVITPSSLVCGNGHDEAPEQKPALVQTEIL